MFCDRGHKSMTPEVFIASPDVAEMKQGKKNLEIRQDLKFSQMSIFLSFASEQQRS